MDRNWLCHRVFSVPCCWSLLQYVSTIMGFSSFHLITQLGSLLFKSLKLSSIRINESFCYWVWTGCKFLEELHLDQIKKTKSIALTVLLLNGCTGLQWMKCSVIFKCLQRYLCRSHYGGNLIQLKIKQCSFLLLTASTFRFQGKYFEFPINVIPLLLHVLVDV